MDLDQSVGCLSYTSTFNHNFNLVSRSKLFPVDNNELTCGNVLIGCYALSLLWSARTLKPMVMNSLHNALTQQRNRTAVTIKTACADAFSEKMSIKAGLRSLAPLWLGRFNNPVDLSGVLRMRRDEDFLRRVSS